MFEMGLCVGLGLVVILAKAPWRVKMAMASHPAKMDIAVFVLLLLLHWGTFSGVMVATIGALMVSLVLSMFRKLYGYRKGNIYYRGMFDISDKLVSVRRGGRMVAA